MKESGLVKPGQDLMEDCMGKTRLGFHGGVCDGPGKTGQEVIEKLVTVK